MRELQSDQYSSDRKRNSSQAPNKSLIHYSKGFCLPNVRNKHKTFYHDIHDTRREQSPFLWASVCSRQKPSIAPLFSTSALCLHWWVSQSSPIVNCSFQVKFPSSQSHTPLFQDALVHIIISWPIEFWEDQQFSQEAEMTLNFIWNLSSACLHNNLWNTRCLKITLGNEKYINIP